MALSRQEAIDDWTVTDSATLSSVALNSTTSTKILDSNDERTFVGVSNNTTSDIWIKLQAASTDNDKKGIFLPQNSYWETPSQYKYVGEISAIAVSGTPTIYVTEH